MRQGDPQAALVLRVVNPSNTLEGAAQLAALLSVRLLHAPGNAKVSVDLAGITLAAPVGTAAGLRTLATRLDAAIRTKVARSETTDSRFREELARFRQILSSQLSRAEQALCLGGTSHTQTDLERLRRAAFLQHRAHWGVVGVSEIVNAAGPAMAALPVWPDADPKDFHWPDTNVSRLAETQHQGPRIELSGLIPNARRSLAALRELRKPTSQLLDVSASLPLPMRLERISSTPLLNGACLSLSLVPVVDGSAATLDDLLLAARAATKELQRLVSSGLDDDEGDALAILEESDPRQAARLATMLALSQDVQEKPPRLRVEIDPGVDLSDMNTTPAQQRALSTVLAAAPPSAGIAMVQAVEQGQGKIHALLASPCAGWWESAKSVGVTGLLMRVLASRYRDYAGVSFEPWVTGNGVGLIAHAGRRSIEETPEDLALRLGDALGRVLGTANFDTNDVWRTRSEWLATLGPGPRPALWRALQAFSPQQPALVVPDGTYASVEAISLPDLREQRTRLLRSTLRLAVLSNADRHQAEVVRDSVARWLSLTRAEATTCPTWQEPLPLVSGEVRLQTRSDDSGDATVTIALTLPVGDKLDEPHTMVLLQLLAGPSGWLSEHLRAAGLVATCEARVVGGTRRRGLVIAIGTLPTVADAATAAIRELFQQLAEGQLPAGPSLGAAISRWALSETGKRFDPRTRLEDIWLSRPPSVRVSEQSMRDYLARAFSGLGMFVVRSERIVQEPRGSARSKR